MIDASYNKHMPLRNRISITLRKDLLQQIDYAIQQGDAQNRSNAIEQVLMEKFGNAHARRAVILGGGSGVDVDGVRTSVLLATVDGKVLIDRHIERLKAVGVEEIILSVGAFGDAVRSVVGDGSRYDISIVYFERDHGTASVLRKARSLLKETFIMLNGHIIIDDVDFEDMILAHKNMRALCTIGLTTIAQPGNYGQVKMRGSHVVQYVEKPGDKESISHIINAGIYIIEPAVCALVRPDEASIEQNIFPLLTRKGMLQGYLLDTPWQRYKK